MLCIAPCRSALAFTEDDRDTIINSFYGAYYARDCSGGYFKRDPAGGVSDFWRYAEMIEMHIDVYERDPSAQNLARISELINGFNGRNTTLWSANGFNDDIMWGVIGHVRAYQITGNTSFRAIAKANWDMAYARGWDTVGDRVPPIGGFYWNTSRTSKNSATNFPATIGAYLLYQALGDPYYLTKANEIFDWGRTNFFRESNGQVYDGLGANSMTPTTYNQGTFLASANFLGHHDDAVLAADFAMTLGSINATTGGGFRYLSNYDPNTDGGGFNGILIRWLARFMRQHGLESRYLPWLQANAQAAWNIRRVTDNLSWTRTHQFMPLDFGLFAWGASNAVVAMAYVPPTETVTPPPVVPVSLVATPKINGIALTWTASSPRFNVKRSVSPGGPYTTVAQAPAPQFLDTDVASDTTYYYVVSAVNSVGESADSAERSTRSPHVPDAVRPAVADAILRAGASANLNFGTAADIFVKLDTNLDNLRESLLRFDVTGLQNATSVKLRLLTTGVGTDGATTTVAFAFLPDDTWSETTVTWNTRPTGALPPFATVTGFTTTGQVVEVDVTDLARAEAAGDGLLSLRLYGTLAGNNRLVPFGARNNCDAAVRPVLIESSGSEIPLPPPAPGALLAIPSPTGPVALSWPVQFGVTRYNVKRATASGGPYAVIAAPVAAVYSDATAVAGTTYYYVVSAVNGFGESLDSPEASATSFVGTVTVDDNEAACTYVGDWTVSTEVPGFNLTGYRHDGNTGAAGGKSATCAPTLSVGGSYEVLVRAPAAATHASNVAIDIQHVGGVTTRSVNQRNNNNAYVSLGRYAFDAGAAGRVTIRNDGADGRVIVDAVRWIRGGPPAPGNVTAISGNAQVALSWTAPVGGATLYRVKRATASGGQYIVIATTSGTSYLDTTVANSTTYYYIVSAVNSIGEGVDSPPVSTVTPTPASIAVGPASQTVTVGDTVTFTVDAAGTAPLAYQWRKGGSPILGATGTSLVLTSVTTTAAGDYDVIVSNIAGSVTSAPATLTVNQALATVVLSRLYQLYDGSPRPVTVATSPAGLTVNVTYGGSSTPPIYPGTYAVVATVEDADYFGTASGELVVDITALVRHAPALLGALDGSVQMLRPESVILFGQTRVSGDLLVPGTPRVQTYASPAYGGTLDGPGAAAPSSFTVTLFGTTLRHVVRRVDPIAMPVVAAPPAPTGTRNVEINRPSDSPGDFATIRNLTLNRNAGAIAVPPGTYGSFTANGNSSFTLGVAGALVPAVYNLKSLVLNTNSRVQVVGPVVINLSLGTWLNGTATIGSAAHPEWLRVNVSSGGVLLNSDTALHGSVVNPAGFVILNGRSRLNGTVKTDYLVMTGSARLSAPMP